VSVPRRIGRQRFLDLAITGRSVEAKTALAWGLVDEVVERGQLPAALARIAASM
jgi:enoyl-CoA hydratase/carnithine racemase